MMNLPIIQNRLVFWLVGLNAMYFALGFIAMLAPKGGIWWSSFVSAWLFVSGSLLFSTVIGDTIEVFKRGVLGRGEIAVIALSLISGGLMWSGAFSLVYNYMGRPEQWIGPMSSYGRACVDVGLVLMFLAPDAMIRRLKPPKIWVLIVMIILVATIGFYFGLSLGADQQAFDFSRDSELVKHVMIRRA